MNEKRFKGYAEKTGQHYELIIQDEIGEEYNITDDFYKSKDVIFEIVDLLNVMNETLLKQAKENHKLSNENVEQQATITALKEENKHFKKELKRCKDWINSDKYDYELTLAFIKNKGYSLKDVLEYEKELKK